MGNFGSNAKNETIGIIRKNDVIGPIKSISVIKPTNAIGLIGSTSYTISTNVIITFLILEDIT
jgi:hypothetical protein